MLLRLLCLLLLSAAGCAHTSSDALRGEVTPTFERVETTVGTFVVRQPPAGTPAHASPAEQLKVVLAGGEAPTVFYAGLD